MMEFKKVDNVKDFRHLPKKGTPHVYALKDKCGTIFYVGQTKNIKNRLGCHLISKKDFDSYYIKEVSEDSVNNEEARLIIKFKPRENKKLPTNDFYTSKNALKEQLNKKISDFVDSLESDFHIEVSKGRQIHNIHHYNALLCHSYIDDVCVELSSLMKLKVKVK